MKTLRTTNYALVAYKCLSFILIFSLLICYGISFGVSGASAQSTGGHDEGGGSNNETCPEKEHKGISLASFRWDEIGVYFTITAFVIIAGFAKLGFHKLHWLSSVVPESCLLILLGLALSAIIYFTTGQQDDSDPCTIRFRFPQFTSEAFFLILLPPVILDSAYSLHDRVFFDNLGSVLLFAVVGTLFNVFAIGATLYGLNTGGLIPNMELNLKDSFVFSSLISAVDPVAVLAIFQELGVNQNLYFLVFGESLLNDGVTVVVYNTMKAFTHMDVVTVGQCFLAVLSFFIVSLGSIVTGIFYGLLTALFTKWTSSVRVVEPLAMLGLAYLSYLTAELFHFSGIICLIVCGLIQAHYGFYNISQKSYVCVKYFTKMASATSDTLIFMFLGMVLVNENHRWNTAFVLWTNVFCLVYRFFAVFVLSAFANLYRTKAIQFEEQFIAAYGGLRGAVAFSLATTLDKDMSERHTYIFTTLVVILFTVFVQGITIKPLVQLLRIKRKSKDKKSLMEEITETSMDHIMAGVEEILGHHGDFYLRGLIMHYNDKYLKKWFLHEDSDNKLTRLFEKIALSEHYAHLYGPVAMVEDQMKPLIKFPGKDRAKTPPMTPHQEEILFRESLFQRLNDDLERESMKSSSSVEDEDENGPRTRRNNLISGRMGTSRMSARLSARLSSAGSFFPTVKSNKVSGDGSTPPPQEKDNTFLRKAFRDNKYNKLHYKYNRNLVDEDDQELDNHLNRRSMKAHRMSTIASASYSRQSTADAENVLPGQLSSPRGKSVTFEALGKSLILMERHRRRSMLQRQRVKSLSEGGSQNEGLELDNETTPAIKPEEPILEESPPRKEDYTKSAASSQRSQKEEEEETEKTEEHPLIEVIHSRSPQKTSNESSEDIL